MGTTHVFVRPFLFSSNVGTYIWNWELGSIGKGDHGLMDTLTVGEVHYEDMVCSSLPGWAPIELFGPLLVEQSGVFFSSLEDLSWLVRRHIPMATYTHETFTHRRHLPMAFIRSQFSLDSYP